MRSWKCCSPCRHSTRRGNSRPKSCNFDTTAGRTGTQTRRGISRNSGRWQSASADTDSRCRHCCTGWSRNCCSGIRRRSLPHCRIPNRYRNCFRNYRTRTHLRPTKDSRASSRCHSSRPQDTTSRCSWARCTIVRSRVSRRCNCCLPPCCRCYRGKPRSWSACRCRR